MNNGNVTVDGKKVRVVGAHSFFSLFCRGGGGVGFEKKSNYKIFYWRITIRLI